MHRFSFSHLADGDLLQSARHEFGSRRLATARFLAQLAEIDARELYLPLAYGSLHAFCIGEFRMCDQQACKWIRVARSGRRFPALLEAIADGRLSRSGAVVLAPHLTEENVGEFLKEAAFKTEAELERLVTRRTRTAPAAGSPADGSTGAADPSLSLRTVEPESEPGSAAKPPEPGGAGLAGLAPETHPLQVRLDDEAIQLLRYAQALLGHAEPSRDPSRIFKRSLNALVAELERRKFGAGTRRRATPRGASANPRHIPVQVRHQVWLRDGGRCTFVSLTGRRCDCTGPLEFDHVVPVARGGESTADNLRLLCRAHNRHMAERVFGAGFMKEKRKAARADRPSPARTPAPFDGDAVRCLRRLGLRADEAREAAANSSANPNAPLDERVRAALQWFGGGGGRRLETAPEPISRAG
ncbi:MAG TPA: HNH endonuclease signature motif containing protein [Candidatus Sulfotelmatobacter sp.]|nr:HNH endonuclease signature motif containing protein [Candidatus Sulfotelmatobacter sp.]